MVQKLRKVFPLQTNEQLMLEKELNEVYKKYHDFNASIFKTFSNFNLKIQ